MSSLLKSALPMRDMDPHLMHKVILYEKGIKDLWKEYMEIPMNAENEWDHRISAGVKKGPANCIRIDEAAAALKKMKRHKGPDLSGLVAEMTQAKGDIGTQWILVLCNDIVKEGCIQMVESQVQCDKIGLPQ